MADAGRRLRDKPGPQGADLGSCGGRRFDDRSLHRLEKRHCNIAFRTAAVPAKAGTQSDHVAIAKTGKIDSRFRGNDGLPKSLCRADDTDARSLQNRICVRPRVGQAGVLEIVDVVARELDAGQLEESRPADPLDPFAHALELPGVRGIHVPRCSPPRSPLPASAADCWAETEWPAW